MDITLDEEQALIAGSALEFAQGAIGAQRIRELESTEDGDRKSVV